MDGFMMMMMTVLKVISVLLAVSAKLRCFVLENMPDMKNMRTSERFFYHDFPLV